MIRRYDRRAGVLWLQVGSATESVPLSLSDAEVDAAIAAFAARHADPQPRTVSPRVFMDALPRARQAEITTAAVAVPDVLLWLLRLASAVEVDLDDAETTEGVAALEQGGLITAEEAALLLRRSEA